MRVSAVTTIVVTILLSARIGRGVFTTGIRHINDRFEEPFFSVE
jgi:hypothetical protein